MREGLVASLILKDVGRFVASEGRLKVEYGAFIAAGQAVVMNRADDGMLLRAIALAAGSQRGNVQVNFDSEILANAAQCVGKIVEIDCWIGAAIRHDDVAAMAANEFVEAEVLEVGSVGE